MFALRRHCFFGAFTYVQAAAPWVHAPSLDRFVSYKERNGCIPLTPAT